MRGSPWTSEDGGPTRSQRIDGTLHGSLTGAVTRSVLQIATTMVIGSPEGLVALAHTGGDDAVSWLQRLDVETMTLGARSADLPGGPTWPGGVVGLADGSFLVAFGRSLHRLHPDLKVAASLTLPRPRPYNSCVLTNSGLVVTKDFGGARPGEDVTVEATDCELVLVDAASLAVLDTHQLPEGSVARLSADGDDIYVVGTHSLWRVRVVGTQLVRDTSFVVPYRQSGGGYGWDAVIVDGGAWFLDNGVGSAAFDGSLRGKGVATAPQRLLRVDLTTGALASGVVHDGPGGVVANPPAIDPTRQIAVGYDSGNGVVTAFDYTATPWRVLWRRHINHGAHPMVDATAGLVVLNDFEEGVDHVVLVEIATGVTRSRVPLESPVQSVLFGAPGLPRSNELFFCSFTHVSQVRWRGDEGVR